MIIIIIMLIAFLFGYANAGPTQELERAAYLAGSVVMVLFLIILWKGKSK